MVHLADTEGLQFAPGARPRRIPKANLLSAMWAANSQPCPVPAAEIADIPETWNQPLLTFPSLFSCSAQSLISIHFTCGKLPSPQQHSPLHELADTLPIKTHSAS